MTDHNSQHSPQVRNLFRLIDSCVVENIAIALELAAGSPEWEAILKERYSQLIQYITRFDHGMESLKKLPSLLADPKESYFRHNYIAFYATLGEWEIVEKTIAEHRDALRSVRSAALLNYVFERTWPLGRIDGISLDNGHEPLNIPKDWEHWPYIDLLSLNGTAYWNEFVPFFPKMQRLKLLFAEQCGLSALPPEIADLQSLTDLWIPNNQITEIPEAIFALKELDWINLDHNHIQIVPEWIAEMPALNVFNVNHNRLTEFPASLFRNPKINLIELSGNKIQQLHVPQDVDLSHVDFLSLGDNPWQRFPTEIVAFPGLKHLYLDKCGWMEIPVDLRQFPALEHLSFENNPLKALPDAICDLKNLMTLYLTHCPLQGLPERIGELSQLERLELGDTEVREFPASFQHLKALKHLTVNRNLIAKDSELAAQLRQWFPECRLRFVNAADEE